MSFYIFEYMLYCMDIYGDCSRQAIDVLCSLSNGSIFHWTFFARMGMNSFKVRKVSGTMPDNLGKAYLLKLLYMKDKGS